MHARRACVRMRMVDHASRPVTLVVRCRTDQASRFSLHNAIGGAVNAEVGYCNQGTTTSLSPNRSKQCLVLRAAGLASAVRLPHGVHCHTDRAFAARHEGVCHCRGRIFVGTKVREIRWWIALAGEWPATAELLNWPMIENIAGESEPVSSASDVQPGAQSRSLAHRDVLSARIAAWISSTSRHRL